MAAASRPPASGRLGICDDGQGSPGTPALLPGREERLGGAMGLSVAGHVILLLMLMLVASSPREHETATLPERLPLEIVWLDVPGEAGGGGGGGQETFDPPAAIEVPGEDPITLPVEVAPEPAPEPEPQPEVEPEPPTLRVDVPAQRMAAALTSVPGALLSDDASAGVGRGFGTGDGAGGGDGDGVGSGDGDGRGPGTGRNTGGGPPGPGSGVTSPVALLEVKPAYTSDALRAKIQGSVWVQCVVRPNGSCTDLEVIRSLDRRFGLDDEALKAASQWQFAPATRAGEPVSVPVVIQLDFFLR
jgi:periplasmic protein TonB